MKKDPTVSHKWWSKMFFPHLLATQAYRYVFRNRPSTMDPAKAHKITNTLSLGYVLFASTAAGLVYWVYQNSGASAKSTESTATFYARLVARNVDDPDTRIVRVKVFDGFKQEDITEEVREAKFGKGYQDYDKYSDPEYVRKRLNVPEGSKKDEKFNVELAGVYLRRVDTDNKVGMFSKQFQK